MVSFCLYALTNILILLFDNYNNNNNLLLFTIFGRRRFLARVQCVWDTVRRVFVLYLDGELLLDGHSVFLIISIPRIARGDK